MAYSELSLPVDIPWKRMGVSKDMIDQKSGDLKFPQKWRSSISAFYHEPTELPPEYCKRKVTYIKIVATLTSYQVTEKDISVLEDLAASAEDFYAFKEFTNNITGAFPCFGALLQVGVYPKPSRNVALHDYPYVAAFQPQKREMYEVVSESGEMASQSASNLNVLKGAMNTRSLENYDLDLGGGGGGGHSGIFGLWSVQDSQNPNKQVGAINRDQTQTQNVRTTDASREKRESHAFSTTVNQIYSLLQGFHLGTNRAIFFMQPRPHIQDSKFSFIPGLRRLEGIQEFFLVINRPDTVPGICIEVALETAHAYLEKAYRPRLIPLSNLYNPGNFEKTAEVLGIDLNNYNHYKRLVESWNKSSPVIRLYVRDHPITYDPRTTEWPELNDMAEIILYHLPDIGSEDIALIFDEYESDNGVFFVTGRRLCACVTPAPHDHQGAMVDCEHSTPDNVSECSPDPGVVFETPYRGLVGTLTEVRKQVKSSAAYAANAQANALNNILWSSLASNDRKQYGATSILETEFALKGLAQVTRLMKMADVKDKLIRDAKELKKFVDKGLGSTTKITNVLDLGKLTTRDIARDLKLPEREAKAMHFQILKAAIKQVKGSTANPEASTLNLIYENFTFQFPRDRLSKLEESRKPVIVAKSKNKKKG